MLNVKDTVTGIDIPIQKLQTFLYNKIKVLWNLSDTTLDGYGRVYNNSNDVGIVPEVFVSGTPGTNNTIYKQVYFDKTTLSAMFFFAVDDNRQFDYSQGSEITKVSIIFIVNLEQVKPLLPHRGDEEVKVDLQKLCTLGMFGFLMTGGETTFKRVFSQFTGINNNDGQIFEDRHPIFCLKINMSIFYQPTSIECL